MKRALCVWLDRFRVDAARRWMRRATDRGRGWRETGLGALVVAEREGSRRLVAACCERAAGLGVRAGMTVSAAQSALAGVGVKVVESDAAKEAALLRALGLWSHRFSPVVALDPPGGLMLDIGGCEGVFGGERALLDAVRCGLGSLGFSAKVASAGTFGCAWGVARCGGSEVCIVAAGGERAALEGLRVGALGLEAGTLAALAEVGIERVGQVLELPRGVLGVRFGAGLLLSVDRALGSAVEVIEPLRWSAPAESEVVFDGPTTRVEAVGAAAREALARVCRVLEERCAGARVFEVVLTRSDLGPERVRIELGAAQRDAARLWRLARPRLERTHLGFGVEKVAATASGLGKVEQRQASRWVDKGGVLEADEAGACVGLIETLVNRLGHERVRVRRRTGSHVPERAAESTGALGSAALGSAALGAAGLGTGNEEAVGPAWWSRPTRLFNPARPARVVALSPDGPVRLVMWEGGEREVDACAGPERIASEWWRGEGPTRDYFGVRERGGAWLWLYREVETGRWFVQGVWG